MIRSLNHMRTHTTHTHPRTHTHSVTHTHTIDTHTTTTQSHLAGSGLPIMAAYASSLGPAQLSVTCSMESWESRGGEQYAKRSLLVLQILVIFRLCHLTREKIPSSFHFSVLQAMESWAEPGYKARLYTETKG